MKQRKWEKQILFCNHRKSNLWFLLPSSSSIFPSSKDVFHIVALFLDNLFPTPLKKYLVLWLNSFRSSHSHIFNSDSLISRLRTLPNQKMPGLCIVTGKNQNGLSYFQRFFSCLWTYLILWLKRLFLTAYGCSMGYQCN